MSGVFSDKATIVLRQLVAHPGKKWTIRDFTEGKWSLGHGWVQKIFGILHQEGYALWIRSGRNSYLKLTAVEKLLDNWTHFYTYRKNLIRLYFSEDPQIEKKLFTYFSTTLTEGDYLYSLFSASRIYQPAWITQNISFYLDPILFDKIIRDIVGRFHLRELKSGGNVWLMKPYYKHSLTTDYQRIKHKPLVSDVQLFLDFFSLSGRGPEQANIYHEKILNKWRSYDATKA